MLVILEPGYDKKNDFVKKREIERIVLYIVFLDLLLYQMWEEPSIQLFPLEALYSDGFEAGFVS